MEQEEEKPEEYEDDVDLVAQAEKEFYDIIAKEKRIQDTKESSDKDEGHEKADTGKAGFFSVFLWHSPVLL